MATVGRHDDVKTQGMRCIGEYLSLVAGGGGKQQEAFRGHAII